MFTVLLEENVRPLSAAYASSFLVTLSKLYLIDLLLILEVITKRVVRAFNCIPLTLVQKKFRKNIVKLK